MSNNNSNNNHNKNRNKNHNKNYNKNRNNSNRNNNHNNNNNNNNNRNKSRNNHSNNKKVKHWRDSYNYREEYLERNPGLFGRLHFCGYCGKPIWGDHNMQVDHIIPPSRFSKKTYKKGELQKDTSLAAWLLNHQFDLVPACPKCNREKSNKISTAYIVKGYGSKVVQAAVWNSCSALAAGALLGAYATNIVARTTCKMITKPIRSNCPKEVKFAYVGLLVLFILALVMYLK